jgi:4-hydroxy-tetrahydrodipicolinate reductase
VESKLLVNGLPGKMAEAVVVAAQKRGIEVLPYSFTGEAVDLDSVQVGDLEMKLVKPSQRESLDLSKYENLIVVDYTHPTAVNGNSEYYVSKKLPFVMGTTGGDRDALKELLASGANWSVIAPNMGKQIVALQTMLDNMAKSFPGLYKGYSLEVVEAHQSHKADTSGTAKAIVGSFNEMGIEFDVEQIEMLRDRESQLAFKVPEEHLPGHAFHTYTLTSPDGTVQFEFKHNVCGRSFYAEGTVDACVFLDSEITKGTTPRHLDMMDVLRAGAMD